MDPAIRYRPLGPEDGPALRRLAAASPDGGRIHVAAVYHVDPYRLHLVLEPDTAGVGAVTAAGELVGAGFVSFGERRYGGRWLPAAELHSLAVHPDYRRRGIGGRLVTWRLECARERFRERGAAEGLIFTRVQAGNAASLALARRWATEERDGPRIYLAPPRRRPPRSRSGILVREGTAADLPAYAAGLSAFTADDELAERYTPAAMADWLARSPLSAPFRRIIVAVDPADRLMAGLALTEQHRAVEMEVRGLPAALRLVNRLLHLVPNDGQLRQMVVGGIWTGTGQESLIHLLWETARWWGAVNGGLVTLNNRSRSHMQDLLELPPYLSTSQITLATIIEPIFALDPLNHYALTLGKE